MKALGGGLSIPLNSFEVSVLPDARPAVLDMNANPGEAREWTLEAFHPGCGYSGAVALRATGIPICVHETRPAIEALAEDTPRD